MKRSLEIAGSDEDSDDEDQTLTLGGFDKGSYDQKPHGDPLKVQALGRYLETCGGSATLVQSWTCVVKTRTTSGDQWVEFMDEANRRFRSQREVALHFGLQPSRVQLAATCGTTDVLKALQCGQEWGVYVLRT